MGALSATTESESPPFPKLKISPALAAPIHRKARISTRDLLREAEDDSMESRAEDDVRRFVFSILIFSLLGRKKRKKKRRFFELNFLICTSAGSRDPPGRV